MVRTMHCGLPMRHASLALLALSVAAAVAACSSHSADAGTPPPDDASQSVFGLAINANTASQTPSREDLRQLGARWERTIVYDGRGDDVDRALRSYRCLGTKNLVLLNQESFDSVKSPPPNDDNGAWETYAAVFADAAEGFARAHKSVIDAVEIWNEPDLPDVGHIAPERFALLVYKTYPRLKAVLGNDVAVVQGAVAGSNWPGYLNDTVTWLTTRGVVPDGFGFHPYGQRSGGYPASYPPWNPGGDGGELSNVIASAWAVANGSLPKEQARPMWITEFGIPANEAPDGVAPYVKNAFGTAQSDPGGPNVMEKLHDRGIVAHAFWFAWDDRVATADELKIGKRFGLVEPTDAPTRGLRDAGQEYQRAAGTLAACATDSESGLDGSRALSDLNADERGKLCDWTAGKAGGYGQVYTCAGAEVSIAKANRDECVAALPATCGATVAQSENCVRALADAGDACGAMARPECAALRRCDWGAPKPRASGETFFAISPDEATFSDGQQPQTLRALGAGMVRFQVCDWPASKALTQTKIDLARKAGLGVLLELNYCTIPGIPDDHKGCGADCQRARQHLWHDGFKSEGNAFAMQFAAVAGDIASAFQGKVADYEIWNEPGAAPQPRDGGPPSYGTADNADWDGACGKYDYGVAYGQGEWAICPAQLGVITTNAFMKIRAADPLAKVVAGNVLFHGDDGWVAKDYWRQVEASAAVAWHRSAKGRLPWDVVGIHPYGYRPSDGTLQAQLQEFRGILGGAADGAQLAITEYGWTAVEAEDRNKYASEADQATFVRQTYDAARAADLGFVMWFNYLSAPGLHFGLRDEKGSWRAAGRAYCESAGAKGCPAP